jgi:hypothetical protein
MNNRVIGDYVPIFSVLHNTQFGFDRTQIGSLLICSWMSIVQTLLVVVMRLHKSKCRHIFTSADILRIYAYV